MKNCEFDRCYNYYAKNINYDDVVENIKANKMLFFFTKIVFSFCYRNSLTPDFEDL